MKQGCKVLFDGYHHFQVIFQGPTRRTLPCNAQQLLDVGWQPVYTAK